MLLIKELDKVIQELKDTIEIKDREISELRGLIQVSEDKYREVLLDNALSKETYVEESRAPTLLYDPLKTLDI